MAISPLSNYKLIKNHDDFFKNDSDEIIEILLYTDDVARVSNSSYRNENYVREYSKDSASVILYPGEEVSFI